MPGVGHQNCRLKSWRVTSRRSPMPEDHWPVRDTPICVRSQGPTLTRRAEIIAHLHTFPDDGHAIKLGRAVVVCRNVCKKYEDEGKDWLVVKGDDIWKNVCHLVVDSVEAPGEHWVRSAGFDEAWKVCRRLMHHDRAREADWIRIFRMSNIMTKAASELALDGSAEDGCR